MPDDEDPIVGAGAANKPEKRNEADNGDGALPTPEDEPAQSASGKHRDPKADD